MIAVYYLYYFVMEWTTGQTVGKMITKSKVVNSGTDEKPVGTVWIAIASSKGVIAKKFLFEKNRDRNIRRTALAAMSMVREVL